MEGLRTQSPIYPSCGGVEREGRQCAERDDEEVTMVPSVYTHTHTQTGVRSPAPLSRARATTVMVIAASRAIPLASMQFTRSITPY